MSNKDYYETLGVSRSASEKEKDYLRQKKKNITRTAQSKKKGENHSRKGK